MKTKTSKNNSNNSKITQRTRKYIYSKLKSVGITQIDGTYLSACSNGVLVKKYEDTYGDTKGNRLKSIKEALSIKKPKKHLVYIAGNLSDYKVVKFGYAQEKDLDKIKKLLSEWSPLPIDTFVSYEGEYGALELASLSSKFFKNKTKGKSVGWYSVDDELESYINSLNEVKQCVDGYRS